MLEGSNSLSLLCSACKLTSARYFLLPQKVLNVIQIMRSNFLWTGDINASRRALVAWDKLCLSKFVGSWNIINLTLWNKAAIRKLLWCLAQKKIEPG